MFINPNAGRVAGGELPPPQDNVTGQTAGTQASPQPGQGGLQGTMVAVGEGGTSALREDAAQTRGWFSGALSAFWEAAEAFTFAMHGDPIDDDAEVRADGGADDEVRTDTDDDDTLTEVDDGEDEFFDCDDDGIAAYNARQLERQALPDGPVGSAGPSSLDDVEILPLSALLGDIGDPGLNVETGSTPAREAVAQQTQQQQDGILSRMMALGGNALGAVTSTVASTVSTVASTVRAYLPGGGTPVAEGAGIAPSQTVSERNLARAGEVAGKIDLEMAKLNEQLRRMGGDALRVPDGERLNAPTLSNWDTLSRWNHQVRGAMSAGLTTLGWTTAAVAIPTATSIVTSPMGWTPTGIGLNATAALGGAYLGLTALRDFPELATNRGALSLVESTLQSLQPQFKELDNLIAQEQSRQTATERTLLVSLERAPRMDALQRELAQVDEALKTAPSDAAQGTALRHPVALGDGQARAQTLGLAARAKSAFQSFFGSIARGLSSVGRFLSDLPNVPGRLLERRAAGKSELAYTQGAGRAALGLLASPRDGGIVRDGVDVRVMQRATDAGASQGLADVRRQMHIGENLTQALRANGQPAFGAVAVGEGIQQVAVTANLTTARAMAWYFAAAAEGGNGQDPAVTRNADGSLSVADPDRKLYSFLMHAPSAYTGAMAGDSGGEPGRLTLDDHRRGFPEGARGMQFETALDARGGAELRVRFVADRAQPVFNPLANEHDVLLSMYQALHSPAQAGERQADFSGWSRQQLEAHQSSLQASLQREASLMAGDQQQVRDLQGWQNPAFLAGRA
ncbi:hypothetical protein [Achromobacter insuavis]|uniref:hypothetical protein n=1 Tax=Achromobacter insuavis TaxID=1287735 RepID=UPI000A4F3BD3|nr:hypothetical protein [Achromobacter insuavis]